jgi:peptidoglycan-N-acetylglucosamine deacetylase
MGRSHAPAPRNGLMVAKMLASVSLDLDNKWAYLKGYGSDRWQDYPSYLPECVPEILASLERLGLTITFFIVGQDASLELNRGAIGAIARAGHEIANHSFHHEPWLHLYSEAEIHQELEATEQALVGLSDLPLRGFRGPGFSHSPTLLRVLRERGYEYDGSTFPTFLGPIARAYYLFTARLDEEERQKRKRLYGTISQGFMSLRPYRWKGQAAPLIEIPVTTMPWFKVPIHMTYVMFLAEKSPSLARLYFKSALHWCKFNRIEPSLLLHPLDFIGGDRESDLSFFPAMKLSTQAKQTLAIELLGWMSQRFRCCTMNEHAKAAGARLARNKKAS